ncbi:MAG: glutamate-5-semialdehyde dehydrogenase [Pleurocapsa sp.]
MDNSSCSTSNLDATYLISHLSALVYREMHSTSNLLAIVQTSQKSAEQLAKTPGLVRKQGVMMLAEAMESSFDEILEANTLDLEMSREMAIAEPVVDWLKLTPERLETAVRILQRLAQSTDPTGKLIDPTYQLESSRSYSQLKPLGTIALVHEAFPELAAIAAGMCLKTGNSLIVRGCNAASNSNQTIAHILQNALANSELPENCLQAISPDLGITIAELVAQDEYLNLVIPYGRPGLIQQVAEQATAPVLKTAMGNCYLYWSQSGDLDLIREIILDSHQGQPDAVNAIEKVLIHKDNKPSALQFLFNSLKEKGFNLRGDKTLLQDFPEYLRLMKTSEWSKPYLSKTIGFQYVDNLSQAASWIDHHSSGHADCIVTQSYNESQQFIQRVSSALVYINASPKFCRSPHGGEAVFLGISNQKGFRQGLIGVEALTTVQQVVQG